ncbi:hypothetical protein CC1G_00560 [Coprinopsis cinerea okayama7|uniref:Uncharacterized protein n=1 Tax=Coprinopsis cinerea (strain Okayama-7 / 130 / ATCC MYA-4618 / FGSC 9003) TaxID=240176 RepID=A8N3D6_COPC7|nr:hypothetical protein CC1G_00560 [Coprinopsis cinerea okayama7\|eukprot:XP_001829381.2 hypothetical protein CC1G_00560 [Coprinopsis cinerea okayama7\
MAEQTGDDLAQVVEKLKAQGNEHYKNGKHDEAIDYYTEAIEKQPNAILYANRAAAYLGLKRYTDAASDCEKAVKLDPTYAKAWGRLGTAAHALCEWPRCLTAWNKAIECLPSDAALTPAQKAMKVQFEDGLKKSKTASVTKPSTSAFALPEKNVGATPFGRALALHEELKARGKMSSAFALVTAYEEWVEGIKKVNNLQKVTVPGKGPMMRVEHALEPLTNALLSDVRAFHVTDPNWIQKCEDQCKAENLSKGGWAHRSDSVDHIKEDIVKTVAEKGWDHARHAIAITVRVWIFLAFLRTSIVHQREFAHDFFTRALEICQWGRIRWPNVPSKTRGTVFERTFIRGIKRLRLLNMFEEFVEKDGPFTPEELKNCAEDILEDVDGDPPSEEFKSHSAAAFASFWTYPKGTALSVLGWMCREMARNVSDDKHRDTFREQAFVYYYTAAGHYAEDDEQHVQFLRVSLDCLFEVKAPLKATLPIVDKIREAVPGVLKIWEMGSIGSHLAAWNTELEEFRRAQTEAIAEGRGTLDTVATLTPTQITAQFDDPRFRPVELQAI